MSNKARFHVSYSSTFREWYCVQRYPTDGSAFFGGIGFGSTPREAWENFLEEISEEIEILSEVRDVFMTYNMDILRSTPKH